jgi:hypothetical protein
MAGHQYGGQRTGEPVLSIPIYRPALPICQRSARRYRLRCEFPAIERDDRTQRVRGQVLQSTDDAYSTCSCSHRPRSAISRSMADRMGLVNGASWWMALIRRMPAR